MPLLSAKALARTYNPPSKRDPWENVQLYHQSQRYPDDWGGARVASSINTDDEQPFEGLSRSNLRAWVEDDGMPDAARATEIAENLGWTADEWTPTTRELAQLVGGIFACGSIDRTGWVPNWSPDSRVGRDTIEAALNQVGVGSAHLGRSPNANGESRSDEFRPQHHASILGRALHVAGAPVGDKNAESVEGLPAWLDDAAPSVRGSFAELLVRERGSKQPQKATRQIQADRPSQYFEDVAALIEDVTRERATASDSGVTISADAVRALGLG